MIKERLKDTALRVCDTCGQEQWVSYWNLVNKDRHLCRYCSNVEHGHFRQGTHTAWNKGKRNTPRKVGSYYLNSGGYYAMWIGKHTLPEKAGGYYLEHRLVAEVTLNRELKDTEIVHHIDGDKTNNHESNLAVLVDDKHHRNVHSQLEQVAMKLYKLGVISFDHEENKYYVDPKFSNELSKFGELLETPNVNDEGNQQRSLRDRSLEERSETIQKWSTLKRVEAPNTLLVEVEGDDIVPSPLKDGAVH